MTQEAATSKRFSRRSRAMDWMVKRLERRKEGFKGSGVARLLQAVKRTEGKATTFLMRLEKLPWAYWLRTRVFSWVLVRGSMASADE